MPRYRYDATVKVFFEDDREPPVVHQLRDQSIVADSFRQAEESVHAVIWETIGDLGSDAFDAPPDDCKIMSVTWHRRDAR